MEQTNSTPSVDNNPKQIRWHDPRDGHKTRSHLVEEFGGVLRRGPRVELQRHVPSKGNAKRMRFNEKMLPVVCEKKLATASEKRAIMPSLTRIMQWAKNTKRVKPQQIQQKVLT